ncbi:prominin-1-A-like isoform X1 [Amblyomma americanum]
MMVIKMHPAALLATTFVLLAAPAVVMSQNDTKNAPGCLSPVDINFTSVDPSSYDIRSVRVPEASGMDHLYSIVTHFAGLVAKPGVPEELLKDDQLFKDPVHVFWNRWREFTPMFKGMLILLGIGLSLALVVPLVGVLVLCCRCCCKRCGGADNVPEKKGDAARRGWRGVVLFLLAVVLLFAVVCAFVTNAYVPAAVMKFPDSLGNSAHDVVLIVNKTKDEVDHLLVKNYREFKDEFEQRLDVCTLQVGDDVAKIITASPAFKLKAVAKNVVSLSSEVNKIADSAEQAKTLVTKIVNSIDSIKQSVEDAYQKCKDTSPPDPAVCDKINQQKKELEFISVSVNLDKIQKAKENLDNIKPAELQKKIDEALDTEKRKADIMDKVKSATDKIRAKLNDVEQTLGNMSNKFNLPLIPQGDALNVSQIQSRFEEASPYITYYGYGTLAIACVLAVVLVCYILGLTWGGCGSREGSCNRKTGGSCLTTGAVIFILAFFIPMVLSTVILAVGIMGQRGICDVARNPGGPESKQLVSMAFRIAGKELPFNLSEAAVEEALGRFSECRNKSYSLFQLLGKDLVMNLTRQAAGEQAANDSAEWLWGKGDVANIDIDEGMKEFDNMIGSIKIDSIVQQEISDKIEELKGINTNMRDLEDLKDKVNKSHLKFNLTEVLTKMESFKSDKSPNVKQILDNVTAELKNLDGLVQKLDEQKQALLPSIDRAESLLKIDDKTLNVYAVELIDEAGKQLQNDVNRTVETAKTYKDKFIGLVQQYLNHTRKGVEENVGDCRALFAVYSATVGSVCDDILLPLNGYWFSVAAFLIVGIPAVMFALCLASLYARVDPATLYLDPLSPVDSDHVSGGSYMDSDTIPLARVNHKRRHTGGNSAIVNRASYDSRDGYYHDISPEYRDHPAAPHHRPVTSPAIAYSPAPAYHYSRDPGLPHYGKGYESAPPPARHSGDWESNQFAKPPPYYYPGS